MNNAALFSFLGQQVTQLISLREDRFSPSKACQVDKEQGVIRGIKIIGQVSENGRRYLSRALSEALPMYEGARVNVDHPPKGKENSPRSVMERCGVLKNARIQEGEIYADLHYLKNHPASQVLAEAAERMPSVLGMSHNADGVCVNKNGELIVESIKCVRHVDIVADPASTRGLFESINMSQKKLSEVIAGFPEKHKTRVFLEEMVGTDMLPADAVVSSETDSDDPVESAFKAAMAGLIDKLFAGKITDDEYLAKTKDMVKMRAKMADMNASKSDDTPATEGKETKTDPGVQQLREEVDSLKRESQCRKLCDTVKFVPDDVQLEALTAMSDDTKRKKLIEGWTKAPERTKASPRSQLLESKNGSVDKLPTDGKTFAALIR